MPYDSCVAGELRRSPEGRLSFTLTCESSDDGGLRPVAREFTANGATRPFSDWIRGLGIDMIADLNNGVAFEAETAKVFGQPLDIVTPLPDTTPEDDKIVKQFTELWTREQALVASVKAGLAKQADLDAAILARKQFYSDAPDSVKPRLDAVTKGPF